MRLTSISRSVLVLLLAGPRPSLAQSNDTTMALTVGAGRPLEIVLDQRVPIKRVEQPITGTLVEPIYVYDRIVVPAGTKVLGHVAALEDPSKLVRTQAMLEGNFTPARQVRLQFDSLALDDGRRIPIATRVTTEIPRLKRASAPPAETDTNGDGDGKLNRVEREAKNRVHDTISAAKQSGRDILAEISQPGRAERLKEALVQRLPIHAQSISAGTAYQAELTQPIDFGRATVQEPATDARPRPASLLSARLVTALDSAKTPRGTPVEAVVTVPVFSDDGRVILPEGTVLTGEVTLAKPAKRLHRNGQLRFLIENVKAGTGESSPLLASLESVQASDEDHLALDDEGGAKTQSPKTRFIAPALALLALRGNLDRHDHLDPDGDGHVIHSGSPTALSVGGFMGFGVLGVPLSHMSPPLGIAFSVVGAARSVYRNLLGKGRDVEFPAHTLIQLQLAPGPSQTP